MNVKHIDCPMCYNKSRVSCEEEDPKYCPICGEPLEDQLEELRFDD
jgi:hypothetical protein